MERGLIAWPDAVLGLHAGPAASLVWLSAGCPASLTASLALPAVRLHTRPAASLAWLSAGLSASLALPAVSPANILALLRPRLPACRNRINAHPCDGP